MKIFLELWDFAIQNKKWWLVPFFILVFILSAIIYVGSGSLVSPFVYTLF